MRRLPGLPDSSDRPSAVLTAPHRPVCPPLCIRRRPAAGRAIAPAIQDRTGSGVIDEELAALRRSASEEVNQTLNISEKWLKGAGA